MSIQTVEQERMLPITTETAMLMFAGVEQQLERTTEAYKIAEEAHRRRRVGDFTTHAETQRLKQEIPILRDELLPMARIVLGNSIIDDSRFTDIEKAAYLSTLQDRVRATERSDRYATEFEGLTDLDPRVIEGSSVYYSPRSIGLGISMLKITKNGLKIIFHKGETKGRWRSEMGYRVGYFAVGATYHEYSGPLSPDYVETVADGFFELERSSVPHNSDFTVQEGDFKEIAPTALTMCHILRAVSGVDFELPELSQQHRNKISREVVAGIDSQARALSRPCKDRIRGGGYQKIVETQDLKPDRIRVLADLVGVDREQVTSELLDRYSQQRAAIINGEMTGESWSELQIAELRLPILLDQIFADPLGEDTSTKTESPTPPK